LSFIGEADLALNASSLSKYTYIFFDFVCFALFYFTLKKMRSFIRRLQRRVNI
jgi:ABC-type amino acid transport system permease subunit